MAERTAAAAQYQAVAVVAVGGVLGAEARYGLGLLWPTPRAAFPWTTLLINVVGCLVIGVFLVAITEGRPPTGWSGRSSVPACWAASPPSPPTAWTCAGCWSAIIRCSRSAI